MQSKQPVPTADLPPTFHVKLHGGVVCFYGGRGELMSIKRCEQAFYSLVTPSVVWGPVALAYVGMC